MPREVYLDHQATTPMSAAAHAACADALAAAWGNPSSSHGAGVAAKKVGMWGSAVLTVWWSLGGWFELSGFEWTMGSV